MTSKSASLTLDQTKAFEDILAVFNMPGWKILAKQLQADQAATADVRNCTDLQFAKGQLSVVDSIVTWPEKWSVLYDMAQAGDVEVEASFGT